jgi:hypothetical protein
MIYGGKKIYDYLKKKEPEPVKESATAGGTGAAGIGSVVVPIMKKKRRSYMVKR